MTETPDTPPTPEPDPQVELLRIVNYPDPFLRRTTSAVAEITDEVREMCERMIHTMIASHGIGLAASQVGWDARVCIVSDTGVSEDCHVLINPEVEETWGSDRMDEGCLSFPGVTAAITRPLGVRVRFTALDGDEYVLEDEELLGRCCQHEIDHLNGVTFLSKMTPADKLANRRALKRLEERAAARAAE